MKLHGLSIGTKLVTLNYLERRNDRVVCVISPNFVAYVKVVKDAPHRYILRVKYSPKNLLLAVYHLRRYLQGINTGEGVKVKPPLTLGKIWPIISHNFETVQDKR